MTGVAVSPTNAVYLSGTAGVRRSVDGGTTWSNWSTGLAGLTNLVESSNAEGIFLGTPTLYTSTNAAAFKRSEDQGTWTPLLPFGLTALGARTFLVGDDEPHAVDELVALTLSRVYFVVVVDPVYSVDETGNLSGLRLVDVALAHGHAYVATEGGGVWRTPFDNSVVGVPGAPSGGSLALAPSQNPLRSAGGRLRFTLPRSTHARLEVMDVTGRRVSTLWNGLAEAGTTEVSWRPATGVAGVYYVVLQTPLGQAVTPVTVTP
jgi:hypothetical protein